MFRSHSGVINEQVKKKVGLVGPLLLQGKCHFLFPSSLGCSSRATAKEENAHGEYIYECNKEAAILRGE